MDISIRYSNLNSFKSLAYLKYKITQKHMTLRPKNLSVMCFFCTYFISGGILTDIPSLKRLRLLSSKGT